MRTRFAPSPTGPLHLGHAYSAILAHDMARAAGGQFLLRIEDIDRQRSKPEWESQLIDDLTWLGLTWDAPPQRQSQHLPAYRTALQSLWSLGLLYPCTCSRRDIAEAANAPQEGAAPVFGPDGLVYPGTCRPNPAPRSGPPPFGSALRLNMRMALEHLGSRLPDHFIETGQGSPQHGPVHRDQLVSQVGDIVVSRKDFDGSYHLCVVLDDAAQNITDVIRGQDLFDATQIHVVLQALLGLPTPRYHHHHLIRDDQGQRLAKRDNARAIARYRADGATPQDIRQMIGLNNN